MRRLACIPIRFTSRQCSCLASLTLDVLAPDMLLFRPHIWLITQLPCTLVFHWDTVHSALSEGSLGCGVVDSRMFSQIYILICFRWKRFIAPSASYESGFDCGFRCSSIILDRCSCIDYLMKGGLRSPCQRPHLRQFCLPPVLLLCSCSHLRVLRGPH